MESDPLIEVRRLLSKLQQEMDGLRDQRVAFVSSVLRLRERQNRHACDVDDFTHFADTLCGHWDYRPADRFTGCRPPLLRAPAEMPRRSRPHPTGDGE